MTVHLLVAASTSPRSVSTGCGQLVELPAGAHIPEDVTGWGSEVTCPECLARRRDRET